MELKPCPFCGEKELGVVEDDAEVFVRCYECGVRGPWTDSANRARVIWNIRILTKEK